MAYQIAFTDQANNGTITIEDGTLNQETSLNIPGRNTTAYGTAIAENFLHLLENFANNSSPDRPIEGQLWYDSTLGAEQLKVYDGTNWVPSGGIIRATSEPEAANSQIGDLWADTDNQQLYLFTGSGWILVGPQFSEGLATGATPITVIGTDNAEYTAIQIEVEAQPVAIVSKDTFTPKTTIPGFTTINPGINLSSRDIAGDGVSKFYGTAEKAEGLIVDNETVAAAQFLRKDVTGTTLFPINIQNNQGINYGINAELNVGVEGSAGVIQHQIEGSNIDVRVRNAGTTKTVIRVDSSLRVGINNEAPEQALDVTGTIQTSGKLLLNDTTESDTVSTGSAIIKGGVGIAKNLNVAGNVTVTNLTTTQNIVPDSNNTRSLGTSTNVWKEVNATTFKGNLEGNVSGTVTGRAGSADKLTSATTFKLTGDVVANDFVFDGQTGGNTKTFTTTISNEIIAAKDSVLESQTDDEILINRTSGDTGLFKISRRNLLSAVPTNPPGVILPYGGNAAPANWLLCDGSQQRISDYPALFEAIGYNFGGRSTLPSGYFKVPDLRGRLPMGADNMGGTSANVVTAESADVIGSTDGSETENILVQNLPEHKHDMRGDSGDQYYALRDVSGTPNDVDAITYDAPTATGNGQALSNSGGVVTGIGESLGTPLNIMNPTITLNYIIYTGRTA
jgi:microcystin-dependent protein